MPSNETLTVLLSSGSTVRAVAPESAVVGEEPLNCFATSDAILLGEISDKFLRSTVAANA